MRKSWIQLYAPFIVLALIQALFIAVAPSRGGGGATDLEALGGGNGTSAGGFGSSEEGGAGGFEGGTDGAGGASGASGTDGAGAGGDAGGGGGGGGGAGPASGGAGGSGDTSHCKGDRQHAVFLNANPPCVPKFSGNNGGETYQGVTGDTVKVIFFSAKPNEQVDAILAQQGLAVPRDKYEEFVNTFIAFINKNYELYGRKIEHKFIIGECPTTPPDYDVCNAEAQKVVKEKPFMVVWNTPLYASVFDIWAKNGIVALGGWQFDDSFFSQRRPFRYDPWMNGTELGANLSEYYCKKLAKQNASHSGSVIHPTVGQRGQVLRKLGIVTPEIEANVTAAKRVIQAVKDCGGGEVPLFTYESDIERATEQTQATVSGLISAKVTTVTCMCDPIAPTFLTNGMSANGYYPEFLLAGTQFMDADLVGRLYNPQQMSHAFGISSIPQQTSLDKSDSTRMWRAMGKQGTPCAKDPCGTTFPYLNLLATGVQMAGPKLNPLTFEQGLLNMGPQGGWAATGNPEIGLWKFGKGDYTWLSDMREVYWDAGAVSPVDGERGAYVALNKGQRYERGQWKAGFSAGIPVRN